jgi:cystine transport system permease protein
MKPSNDVSLIKLKNGIISIPKGQTEAAYSIGMNYRQTIQRIILPQAIRDS